MKWMKESRAPSGAASIESPTETVSPAVGVRRLFRDTGLDPRCIRLFRARLPGGCSRQQLSRWQRRHRLDHHHHPGDAAGWRGGPWFPGRSLRPPPPLDRVRPVLLHHHRAHSVRAQLRRVRCPARSLWHRHGRILGHRRLAGYGELSRNAGADSSPESCRPAIPWDTCWPRLLCG